MRVLLYGKNAKNLTRLLTAHGIEVVGSRPDAVLSYGGDGTLLTAERKYPGIPKLALRDSAVCAKCAHHTDEIMIQAFSQNKLPVQLFAKLTAVIDNTCVSALNDIVIRNALPMHAIRFYLLHNGACIPNALVIGDGIVAATPFGSTGYFKSVTRSSFAHGFAAGFNNSVSDYPPIPFQQGDTITVEIIRGPAALSFDNAPKVYKIADKCSVTLGAGPQKAQIFTLDTLRCPKCQTDQSKHLLPAYHLGSEP